MWIKKWKQSLTAKICLATFLLLAAACCLTYAFIAWMMPRSYAADLERALAVQVQILADELSAHPFEECHLRIAEFAEASNVRAGLLTPLGSWAERCSLDGVEEVNGIFTPGEDRDEVMMAISSGDYASRSITIGCGVTFPDMPGEYQVLVVGSVREANQAAAALGRVWPWLAAAILLLSLLAALFYARFITRPIVEISAISQKLSALDFGWRCRENRTDEIGTLAHNLNSLTDRLSAAMTELRAANDALRADICRERELEQARLDFFSAASHELKTPITILKGQLGGMLDGVGRYADRDRWLARSLSVVGRMERLVRELLTVSRLEREDAPPVETLCLSALTEECVREYAEMFEQRRQQVRQSLPGDVWLAGDAPLLKKAVCSLLSNAVQYSPEGAAIYVTVRREGTNAVLTVENEGAHLNPETIPRLFEAFYRPDPSRNRQTGGSGLGLYLVRTIAGRHGGTCAIQNTGRGVEARLMLPGLENPADSA